MNTKILVVDDETSIRKFLKVSLEANQFEVVEAHNGNEALQKVIEARPGLVILDHGLPDMNGIEVLKKLREWSSVPVIFLTVRDADEDKVQALDNGADDYLTKPFSLPELMARIRVALRHSKTEETEPVLNFGKLSLNQATHKVSYDNHELKLTSTEYDLLKLLLKNGEKLVPHRMILKEIWGPNSVEHNHYLRVYFGQIRKKLDQVHEGAGEIIENESGVGYRLKNVP
ncbi:DNA-binding response regulator [Bacteriovorax stolpii]|uniref:DNA-binding response regulator n=1 Tax=Bacteriovorax stolpii TaxID=960 RepID=A0A2K9NP50_BACTC|nr:response regulator transcription factor [Bacteriovorax stolpii]AUN97296.1 DNA-binding response regulator [Bacteriovorax stolpii]QDK42766.1 DNA-binding response regulator [Bacteriovorax stolpii]TDP52466.1 two-component system KDP operon response regulator KdpE [Bacteriovorax stolpii]